MKHVWDQVERIGTSPWPALILGESGTGKEVVARLIHERRSKGPFVVVDCSSIAGPLMESELFGHVRGSFTGAAANKIGLLELANGGTAFFDEIGELPLDFQAKLLRVLQEKEFRPVGSVRTKRSEFCVVAATNRDLAAEVTKGTFRQDLYYRLKVMTVRMPALRDRPEDIPELVAHFIRKYGDGHVLAPEGLDALMRYDWPGNVRELEHCVQHMVAAARSNVVVLPDLPTSVVNHVLATKSDMVAMANALGHSGVSVSTQTMEAPHGILPLSEVERRAILNALRFTKGDRTSAATLLGIGRTTLYRKLKQYDLETIEAGSATM